LSIILKLYGELPEYLFYAFIAQKTVIFFGWVLMVESDWFCYIDLYLWPRIAPSVLKLETSKFGSRQPHPLQNIAQSGFFIFCLGAEKWGFYWTQSFLWSDLFQRTFDHLFPRLYSMRRPFPLCISIWPFSQIWNNCQSLM